MPLVEELTFQFKDSGVILNADTVSFPMTDVTQVDGLDSPSFRDTQHDFEGADGGFVEAEFEKARVIVIEGTIYDQSGSLEVFLDTLKANYAPNSVAEPFYFKAPGVTERKLYCKSLGIRYSWSQARRIGLVPFQVTLVAENPAILGAHHTTTPFFVPTPPTTGRAYPKFYPKDYGPPVVSLGQFTVDNGGNKYADAVFSVYGDLGNFKITSVTEGKYLDIQLSLTSSDVVTIDTRMRTIYLNGVNRHNALVGGSKWFKLQPGRNVLQFNAAIPGAGYLVLDFDDSYR